MLRPGRFNGDERTLLRTAGAVWCDFCTPVADVALGTSPHGRKNSKHIATSSKNSGAPKLYRTLRRSERCLMGSQNEGASSGGTIAHATITV